MAFNGQVSVSVILQSVFIQPLVHKVLLDLQNNPRKMFLCIFLQLWRAKNLNFILFNLSIKPQCSQIKDHFYFHSIFLAHIFRTFKAHLVTKVLVSVFFMLLSMGRIHLPLKLEATCLLKQNLHRWHNVLASTFTSVFPLFFWSKFPSTGLKTWGGFSNWSILISAERC